MTPAPKVVDLVAEVGQRVGRVQLDGVGGRAVDRPGRSVPPTSISTASPKQVQIGGGGRAVLDDLQGAGPAGQVADADAVAGVVQLGHDVDVEAVDRPDHVADGLDTAAGEVDGVVLSVAVDDLDLALGDARPAVETAEQGVCGDRLQVQVAAVDRGDVGVDGDAELLGRAGGVAAGDDQVADGRAGACRPARCRFRVVEAGGDADAGGVDPLEDVVERLGAGQVDRSGGAAAVGQLERAELAEALLRRRGWRGARFACRRGCGGR